MKIMPLNSGEKLNLKNDGNLELFFIGVGSSFALKNNQTNFIIKGDKHIMVDFGMDGPKALMGTARLDVVDIECILPTHSHDDHANGIGTIGLQNRYVGMRFMKKPKVKMIITEEYQRVLWTHTLQGTLEWNEMDGFGHKLCLTDFF